MIFAKDLLMPKALLNYLTKLKDNFLLAWEFYLFLVIVMSPLFIS